MNLLNRLSGNKKEIEAFIKEKGMEEAVNNFGLAKLIKYFILNNL